MLLSCCQCIGSVDLSLSFCFCQSGNSWPGFPRKHDMQSCDSDVVMYLSVLLKQLLNTLANFS